MKKRSPALKAVLRPEARAGYHSGLWSIHVPAGSMPLEGAEGLRIQDETEHAFFLCCCELYRVIERNHRELPRLIETYSRYRTREHFRDAFAFRYFDADLSQMARFDPDLAARQIGMFNMVHELRSAISFTDALPHTIRTEIETVLMALCQEWNRFRDAVRERYGWEFKRIG